MSASNRTRATNLGYIDLGDDSRPKHNKEYSVISAGDEVLESKPYPDDTDIKRLNLDLYGLYINDLPDLTKRNEGLLKITVNTRDPQNLESSPNDASIAIDFEVKDGNYAPSFMYRGVYRNILFREWINLRFDLFEIDTDASEYYNKIKNVVEGVPEIKNLDVLKGIPYLNLATKLFDSIITTFGKNPDDHIWSEIPILELMPTPGGAFLRSGIFVLYEGKSGKQEIDMSDLRYKNKEIYCVNGKKLPNHLLFGMSIREHKTQD